MKNNNKTEVITVRLHKQIKDYLINQCNKEFTTISGYINNLIVNDIKRGKK